MKKFAKLSLVAAVAVAGLTTANASSLEEAIKGVDVSGMVRYRFTETKEDKGVDKQENDYDIELTAKIPVNDMVKAVVKIDVDGDLSAESDKGEGPNAKPSVNVEDAYFSYTNSGFVVNAGKQDDPSPLTDGLDGTGIVALAPMGPVTAAAGYMNASDAGFNDIYLGGLMGSFDMVNVEGWYGTVEDLADAYTVAANGQIGPVSLGARYSAKEMDNETKANDDLWVLKIMAEASLGMFDLSAGFAQTGDDNGTNGGAALDSEADAVVNDFQLEQKDVASEMSDATAWKLGVSVNPVEKISLGLDYLGADYEKGTKDVDYNEYMLSAAYKMSKNFKISSFYSIAEDDDVDTNKGRLELKYTF